ncbi:MAG: fibronectin type III domain-containing protein [Acidimicrobiales bacterium]
MALALASGGLSVAAGVVGVTPAFAECTPTTLTVTSTNDSGAGSLRQAVLDANCAGDVINFSVGGTITLTSGSITFPPVSITIQGPGATQLAISGPNGGNRLFVNNSEGTETISGLTLENGSARVVGGDGAGNGGAISAQSSTTHLINDVFLNNSAQNDGGAVYSVGGVVNISGSTFQSNSASSGGAILIAGRLAIVNSTFAGNSAVNGGGIYLTRATASIDFVTMAADTASNSGAALYNLESPAIQLLGSILDDSPGADNNCNHAITDQGYNISDGIGNGCGLGASSKVLQSEAAIALGALQVQNGGTTPTMAIDPSSVAWEIVPKANCTGVTTVDQNGVTRPQPEQSLCSAGAFEPMLGVGSGAPGAPQDLTATDPPAVITLSWNPPAYAGGSSVTTYDIFRWTQGQTMALYATVPGNATSYVDNGATPGVTYYYAVEAVNAQGTSPPSNVASATIPGSASAQANGAGYVLAGQDGGVYAFGSEPYEGSLPGVGVHVNDIVGMISTPDGRGYWLVGSDGGVYAFGDAVYHGSVPGLGIHVNDVVGMISTPDGRGYWLVGSDGGVFGFGDAAYRGSVPGRGVHVNDIVGIDSSPDGGGYWLVGSDGGVYAFGDAIYHGSVPGLGIHVNDVTSMASTPDGGGYWLVGADGGVFNLGDATYHGSVPGLGIHVGNVVSILPTADGAGYWIFGSDGGVFNFGDAAFAGSLGGRTLNAPIVGAT